jgi:hypothetical protein
MAPGADWEWMDQKLDREGMEAIARKHQPELETCISSVKKKKKSRVLVAHACNPSYSRGRDQEDRSSKPAQANKFMRPYLEKPFTKIGLMEWLKMK